MTRQQIEVARAIKETWQRAYEARFGVPFRFNERTRPLQAWASAARNCIDLKADPVLFVEAQFRFCRDQGAMFPAFLGGRKAAENYKRVHGGAEDTGIPPAFVEADAPERHTQDICDELAETGFHSFQTLVWHWCGLAPLNDPAALKLARLVCHSIDPVVRVMVFPSDKLVWDLYGGAAQMALRLSPSMLEAYRRAGDKFGIAPDVLPAIMAAMPSTPPMPPPC